MQSLACHLWWHQKLVTSTHTYTTSSATGHEWIEPVEYSRTGQMPYTGGNEPVWATSVHTTTQVMYANGPGHTHRKCETGQLILIKNPKRKRLYRCGSRRRPSVSLARLPYSHDGWMDAWKTRSEPSSSHTHARRLPDKLLLLDKFCD